MSNNAILRWWNFTKFEEKNWIFNDYDQIDVENRCKKMCTRATKMWHEVGDSIQCLNFVEKWFKSIFDSIMVTQNSIQTIIQFKIKSADSIQKKIQFNSQWASFKWSTGWTGLLQMIIRMDRPLANDHLDGPTSCKLSSGWTGLLPVIRIQIRDYYCYLV